MNIELIGYTAGIVVSLSLVPQVIKSWRTRSTKDISLWWTLVYLLGLGLWVTYGIMTDDKPLMITIGIEFLMAFSLLVMKLLYK